MSETAFDSLIRALYAAATDTTPRTTEKDKNNE